MSADMRNLDDLSRRAFICQAAKAFLGVSLMPLVNASPVCARVSSASRAKNVIYLYMDGGMSHLDTFDTKPDSNVQGPVQSIQTNADGVRISEYLPLLGRQMDKVAVLRSMYSTQGAHEQGRYFMHTGYISRGTIRHPAMSAWVMKLSGRTNKTLPGNVMVGGYIREAGAGFLGPSHAPLVIGDPQAGLQNSQRAENVTQEEFDRRLKLASRFDRQFRIRYKQDQVHAYTDMYDDAIRLMASRDLTAFEIERESERVRDGYGQNAFGQGCLLARRLIQKDVRFVEVTLGGWDTHSDNFDAVQRKTAVLDQGMSTLLADLSSKGLLKQTLVVLATEFGRTPQINENNGRDHHPKAFTCLLAGGGIRGGQVYGRTDASGSEVEEHRVKVPDFNATIAYALGLPLDKVVHSPSGRPFTVAHKGQPVTSIF